MRSAGPLSPLCRCPPIFMHLMPTAYSRSRIIGTWSGCRAFSRPCNPVTGDVGPVLQSGGISARVWCPTRYFRECFTRIYRSAFLSGRYQAVGSLSQLERPTIYQSQRGQSLHISQGSIRGPKPGGSRSEGFYGRTQFPPRLDIPLGAVDESRPSRDCVQGAEAGGSSFQLL